MTATVTAVVRPMIDHRRLIRSIRPRGPAAPSMTTGKDTTPIVDGTAAIAQTSSVAATTAGGGARSTATAIDAYERWASIRPRLYQGTMPARRWRNWPIGIARRNPT